MYPAKIPFSPFAAAANSAHAEQAVRENDRL
jgi:hypothetical protein